MTHRVLGHFVDYRCAIDIMRMMYYYSVSDTGILGKKIRVSYQASNLRPSDY